MQEPRNINAFAFRSIVRAVIIYYTFCRFDDYSRLKDSHLTDKGSYIDINFERSKNDQYGGNTPSVIKEQPEAPDCPVKLIRLYFSRFGLKFGGTGKLLNFRLERVQGRHVAMPGPGVSRGQTTKCTRRLLAKHGYESALFTEKSMKVQGVTELFAAGESLENVTAFGRWRRLETPLHYRNHSVQFRLGVAGRIPTGSAPDPEDV